MKLIQVQCPGCGRQVSEPLAPFDTPYVVTRPHHRMRRKPCRLAIGVWPTGKTMTVEIPDGVHMEDVLLSGTTGFLALARHEHVQVAGSTTLLAA